MALQKTMMAEIITELTDIKDTSEATSGQMLSWANRIEAHQSQKVMFKV